MGCMHALLLAVATTQLIDVHGSTAPRWAEVQGQPTIAGLIQQHAAPPQPAAASPSDAGEPAVISPTLLPAEILLAAERGELQKVVKWLRKEGPVDALRSTATVSGRNTTATLLHAAAAHGQLEMVRELLKRGASVDLQNSVGITALMLAAIHGDWLSLLLAEHLGWDPVDIKNIDHLKDALSKVN